MPMNRRRMAVLACIAAYVAAMGFAGGVMSERIRFDRERAAVLHRYDEAVREWHQLRMAVEGAQDAGAPAEAR